MLKKSFNLFKKKFYYFILIDGLFFILLFLFLNYSRNKVQNYLQLIQQYIPKLNEMQSLLQQSTDVANLDQTTLVLNSINSIVRESLIFGYFIIPFVIFILWALLQGLNYKIIFEDKMKNILDYKFFIKFLVISLPFFVILTLIAFQFLSMFTNIVPYYGGQFEFNTQLYLIILIPIILFYFLLIFYSLLNNNSLLRTLRKGISIAIKKIHYLFPLYLGYLVIFILFMVAFMNNFVFYIGNFNAFSFINILITIILLVILSYYRILFTLFSNSFS
ncbi:hypothetical protein HYX17_03480 [Candidatus Woesearchaeota archaeon]|nr:hypothetical protein [Candidatus Woesearchaeota archaeon]